MSGLRCVHRHRKIGKLPLVQLAGRVEMVELVEFLLVVLFLLAGGLVGILHHHCSLARVLVAVLTHIFLHCVY